MVNYQICCLGDCCPVVKVIVLLLLFWLLFRDVSWEDLAFFNADLFEGLSRMILDGTHPLMTSERFQSTYCCHFEVEPWLQSRDC